MTQDQKIAWVKWAASLAKAVNPPTVPVSVTVAQAIDESRWGLSDLARLANNFFGIKTAHLHGEPYVRFETHEGTVPNQKLIVADFRKYNSPAQSFADHASLLASAKRYQHARDVADDPVLFAQALKECGYCTNDNYPRDLIRDIREFNLTQYDVAPPPPSARAAAKGQAA
jgi:flagellum-specific peptidoglycan hydrolase FlgJ